MSDPTWEPPVILPTQDILAWIVWLMARDLATWTPERRTSLTREEAMGLTLFLADHLPEERRTPIEPLRPYLKTI